LVVVTDRCGAIKLDWHLAKRIFGNLHYAGAATLSPFFRDRHQSGNTPRSGSTRLSSKTRPIFSWLNAQMRPAVLLHTSRRQYELTRSPYKPTSPTNYRPDPNSKTLALNFKCLISRTGVAWCMMMLFARRFCFFGSNIWGSCH
jgi:hypothetical protein